MIRIRRLTKEYAGGTRALHDVSLEIAAGEFVALIGPSGAGKSSLLRCVNGLVAPTSGEVLVNGVTLSGASDDRLRQVRARIGFVFQQFNLLRRLAVLASRTNIRAAAILGFVGAGGIGFYVQTSLRMLNYPAASTVLLVLVALVMLVDFSSSKLRAKLV